MSIVVAFDLDGTLLDTLNEITLAANMALQRTDPQLLPFSEAEMKTLIGDGAKFLMQKVLHLRGINDPDILDFTLSNFLQCYDEISSSRDARPYPGVLEGLQQLKTQLPSNTSFCICTNKPHALALKIVQQSSLSDFFIPVERYVTGASSDYPSKPHAMHLQETVTRASGTLVPPAISTVIMVGDSKNDILVAQHFGCLSIGVTYGFGESHDLVGATAVVSSFSQVVTQIVQFSAKE